MSNTYDDPIYLTFNYEGHDFGAGGATKEIALPDGMRGRVVDIMVTNVTEQFTNTTTEGKVQVGISGTLDKFADFGLGTTASGSAAVASANDGDLKGVTIASNEDPLITFVGPTGGTPAGIADVQVVVAAFN